MGDADRIIAGVQKFNKSEWKIFARARDGLDLTDFEIEEVEENNTGNMIEQRYQMVRKWQSKSGRSATIQKFEELLENRGKSSAHDRPSLLHEYSSATDVNMSSEAIDVDDQSDDIRIEQELPAPVNNASTQEDSGIGQGQNIRDQNIRDQNNKKAFNESNFGKTNTPTKSEYNEDAENRKLSLESSSSNSSGAQNVRSKSGKNTFRCLLKPLFGRKKKKSTYNVKKACDRVKDVLVVNASKSDYIASLKKKGIYQITGPKKGLVLILNNSVFDSNTMKTRKGSELDVKHMEKLWTKIGCKLYQDKSHCDKTASEMLQLLNEVSNSEGYSFLVIVIMTHGGVENNENFFCGIDEDDQSRIYTKKLEQIFHNNKKSRDIPKFFILQFCRGCTVDKGLVVDSSYVSNLNTAMKSLTTGPEALENMTEVEVDGAIASRMPSASKILTAYATMDGYAAMRHAENGSWFINAITNIFMACAWKDHVGDLLVKVHEAMEKKEGKCYVRDGIDVQKQPCKAMSNHVSSLTKSLYLYPGHP